MENNHTTPSTTEEWENRFDEMFSWGNYGDYLTGDESFDMESARRDVKTFIRTLLSSREAAVRRQERKRVVEIAEKVRKTPLGKDQHGTELYTYGTGDMQFNIGVDAVITNLRAGTD